VGHDLVYSFWNCFPCFGLGLLLPSSREQQLSPSISRFHLQSSRDCLRTLGRYLPYIELLDMEPSLNSSSSPADTGLLYRPAVYGVDVYYPFQLSSVTDMLSTGIQCLHHIVPIATGILATFPPSASARLPQATAIYSATRLNRNYEMLFATSIQTVPMPRL
jgi:hypothetical protein